VAVRDILLETNAHAAFKRGLPEAVEVMAHAPRIGINSGVSGAKALARAVLEG
jgi:hypothetical protein